MTQYSAYIGRDYPSEWPLQLDTVQMSFEDHTVHYALAGDVADKEWAALLPSGGVVVHLGPANRPFTVSMFHQLRCLDTVRRALAVYKENGTEASAPARHCLNYLRQMIMCRANTRLERATGLYGAVHNVISEQDHICQDWRVVYNAVKQNHDL